MVSNQAFEDYITSFDDIDSALYWADFNRQEAWELFTEWEREYDCAGICYTPLFFLTKSISDGLPKKECVREVILDIFYSSQNLCYGMGAALLLSVFC
jgi:hypothetical protein